MASDRDSGWGSGAVISSGLVGAEPPFQFDPQTGSQLFTPTAAYLVGSGSQALWVLDEDNTNYIPWDIPPLGIDYTTWNVGDRFRTDWGGFPYRDAIPQEQCTGGWVNGGWVTGGTAEKLASEQAQLEVVAALVPICLDQYQRDPNSGTTIAELKGASTYQRRDILIEAGWATMPGATEASNSVANACVREISASF